MQGKIFHRSQWVHSPEVVLINETMARRFWPNENPIGNHVKQGWPEWTTREVIGVVADVKLNVLSRRRPFTFTYRSHKLGSRVCSWLFASAGTANVKCFSSVRTRSDHIYRCRAYWRWCVPYLLFVGLASNKDKSSGHSGTSEARFTRMEVRRIIPCSRQAR